MKSLPVTAAIFINANIYVSSIKKHPLLVSNLARGCLMKPWNSTWPPALIWRPLKSRALKMPSPCLTWWNLGECSDQSRLLKWSHLAKGTICNGALCWQVCKPIVHSQCAHLSSKETLCMTKTALFSTVEGTWWMLLLQTLEN